MNFHENFAIDVSLVNEVSTKFCRSYGFGVWSASLSYLLQVFLIACYVNCSVIRFGFYRHKGECICFVVIVYFLKIVVLFDFFKLSFCIAVKTYYAMFDGLIDLRLYMVFPATFKVLKGIFHPPRLVMFST